jgi:sugar lactone lactonase YvrE
MTVHCILQAADAVGESPVWDAAERALYWVDIAGRRLHRLEPESGRHDLRDVPELATSVSLRAKGGLILGLTRGLAFHDFERLETFVEAIEPDFPGNRLNEARVDPEGRYCVGTMANNLTPEGEPKEMEGARGALHLVTPEGRVARLTPNEIGITNTMIWSGERFVTADTQADALYAFDRDPASGALSNRRAFADSPGRGAPDGSCVDAEGFIWNARFGGGCLVRFAPDGRVDRVLELPCSNPTCCAFGGEGLATLFVTSARTGLTPDRVAENPQEGGLFACDVGVSGPPEPRFAG